MKENKLNFYSSGRISVIKENYEILNWKCHIYYAFVFTVKIVVNERIVIFIIKAFIIWQATVIVQFLHCRIFYLVWSVNRVPLFSFIALILKNALKWFCERDTSLKTRNNIDILLLLYLAFYNYVLMLMFLMYSFISKIPLHWRSYHSDLISFSTSPLGKIFISQICIKIQYSS